MSNRLLSYLANKHIDKIYNKNIFHLFLTDVQELDVDNNNQTERSTDQILLKVLGANPKYDKKLGEDLHEEVSVRWDNYATKGVDKNIIEDLVKKFPPPNNCQALQAPKLNSEIEICLTREAKKQDVFITQLQTQTASVLSAIGILISDIIKNRDTIDQQKILSTLVEGGQILCENIHQLSNHRRFLIKPFLKEERRKVVNECPIDEYLFGKKLQESIQSDKTVAKAGRELKRFSPYKNIWTQKNFVASEPQPGPSGLQLRENKTKNTGHLNYQRPQSNWRRRTTMREYNKHSRKHQFQRRNFYNPQK